MIGLTSGIERRSSCGEDFVSRVGEGCIRRCECEWKSS